MSHLELGQPIPPDTDHAVSFSLPTWRSSIGYEEGEQWVMSRMTSGYPRFFIHQSISSFAQDIILRFGRVGHKAMLFPAPSVAKRCVGFIEQRASSEVTTKIKIIDLILDSSKNASAFLEKLSPTISAVLLPDEAYPLAKQYWQHTGEGTSSRRAEFCHDLFKYDMLVPAPGPQAHSDTVQRQPRSPRRYQRLCSIDGMTHFPSRSPFFQGPGPVEHGESCWFLEERLGRNLDLSMAERAKSALRKRIAVALADADTSSLNTRGTHRIREDDVYLFPTGMSAIFNMHRILLQARGPGKSINFGFPYVDTLKVLQKFGPGCIFYGFASTEDLDDLENRLRNGERFLALFCEFPGNPLLVSPDLERIRDLADKFDFAIVVDETIGSFANTNVLRFADIVVSSLTKVFSGDCNVMGGSSILNPESTYYRPLKAAMQQHEDTYWPEDAIFMERNSRDFQPRVDRINVNSEAICDILRTHPLVRNVFYPKYNPSRANYDVCRLPNRGYGGLLSIVFKRKRLAQVFYDAIDIAKGPSLGTNFTLCSPYALLAHYWELPWAAQFGVDPDLIRISVGLEETYKLQAIFRKALKVVDEVASGNTFSD